MNLMSNDEVDKLSCIMMKLTSLRQKKRTASQKRKLIDTPFANVLSENLYILILCCQ